MGRRFLYFVEGLAGNPARVDVLRACEFLAYAFPAGESFSSCECARGPGDGAGVLCAHGDGSGLRYSVETHAWTRIGEKVWLGAPREPGDRPGPDDLLRRRVSPDSMPIVMADGRSWLVPTVRFVNGNTGLPCVLTLDSKTGGVRRRVRNEYRALYELADEISAATLEGRGPNLEDAELVVFVGLALAVNYRLGPCEAAVLELIDTENVRDVAAVALDEKTLRLVLEELKKKLAPSPSGPGSTIGAEG